MSQLVIRRLDLPVDRLPRRGSGFRIAHLSDLHLRRWGRSEQQLQEALKQLACDTLLITGDFGHDPEAYERTGELIRRLLAPLSVPLGIYGVLGNHDSPRLAEQDLPLTVLRDELRLIHVGPFEYYLGGIEQNAEARATVGGLGALPDDAPLVLMAHYPSTVFELPSGRGAIMLSGHTHGGQIRLPGLGCLWANDPRLPRSMARGLHLTRGNWLHVSAGTGTSGPISTRVLCPAGDHGVAVALRGTGRDFAGIALSAIGRSSRVSGESWSLTGHIGRASMATEMWEVEAGVALNPTAQLYLYNLSPRLACFPTSYHRSWGRIRARLRINSARMPSGYAKSDSRVLAEHFRTRCSRRNGVRRTRYARTE
jgi:predicted MPP superfamily phosphohydrolase